jgi:N-acetylglucosaminyl-diphospho-decaprenol L-rhamnosyltransferase
VKAQRDPAFDSETLISVVFVTYNSAGVIRDAIASVRQHLPAAEVVIVDNGSTDETIDLVRRAEPEVLVPSERNTGFGSAVNIGVSAATRPLVLVLNPDVRITSVDHVALSLLVTADAVGLLGCVTTDGSRQVAPDWSWPLEVSWTLLTWFLVPRELEIRRPRPRRHRPRWIGGAAFFVLRTEFLEVGGFDERIFLYYEDVDLARRYGAARRRIALSAAVKVDHIGRASSPRDETFMMLCALLGLFQTTANWRGPQAARRAASLTRKLLRLLERGGGAVAQLPVIGPRAHAKAAYAQQLRTALFEGTTEITVNGFYPDAMRALGDRLS